MNIDLEFDVSEKWPCRRCLKSKHISRTNLFFSHLNSLWEEEDWRLIDFSNQKDLVAKIRLISSRIHQVLSGTAIVTAEDIGRE